MRQWIAALAALAGIALAAPAADAKTLDEILSDGTIRVGINPNFPNMSTRGDDGEWEGFDIDVGNAIAEALGVEVEWVPTETAQRVPFLVSDRIDISLGALTRNAERAKLIDYTVPLHTEVLAVLDHRRGRGGELAGLQPRRRDARQHARQLDRGLDRGEHARGRG